MTHTIGVDAATRSMGICILDASGEVLKIDHFPLMDLTWKLEEFKRDLQIERVSVWIEKVRFNHRRFAGQSIAGNQFKMAVKRLWPRMNTIHTVNPRTWQKQALGKAGKRELMKELSIKIADAKRAIVVNDDESDAFHIARYGYVEDKANAAD